MWSSVRRLTNGALTDDEHAVVWRRFAEHVVMQATILGGERHGPDVAALDHRLEHFAPHLEHIAKRATASDPLLAARALAGWGAYASRRGPFGPFERLCDDVIARLDDDTPEVRLLKARILLDYAAVRFHRADFVGAQTRALSAMELSGELDARLTAEANTVLMVILQCQGTGETPADIMPSSMAAAFALGVLLVHRGDLVGCVQCCERALVLSYVGETRWRGRVRWLLGLAYHERGLLAEADTSYREARTLLTEAGDAYFHVVLEHCVALLEHERGDTSAAITRKEPLRQQLEDIGDVFFSGSFDGYQALLLMTRRGEGDLERAAALFDRALQIARGSGDHYRLSLFLPARAMLACEHGDVATARAYLHEVKPFAAMPVNRNVPAMASLARARLALLEGRPDEAAACCLAVRRPEQTAHGEHPPIVDVSSDVRFLLRVLEQALERSGVHPPQAPRSRLVVFDDGFVVNDGAFVSLKKHRTLLRVLRALTVLDAFGKTTQRSTKDIISAVWPGQQFEGDSGAHRVHVAVSTLRRMGMSAFLHHRSGSYLIDADVECRLSELEFGRAASEP